MCACTWGVRVGTGSSEQLENFTSLKPASICKGLGWSSDFCSFLPVRPHCCLILILGFAQVTPSSECISPRSSRAVPFSVRSQKFREFSTAPHQPNADAEEIQKNPL